MIPGEAEAKPERALVTEEEQGERLKALYASFSHGNAEALRQAVFDQDPSIQAEAFKLLAKWDHQEATAVLVGATTDETGRPSL